MKIYLGYHCTYNLCDMWKTVEKVFDDEVKALLWAEDAEFAANAEHWNDQPTEWREYVEMEVE